MSYINVVFVLWRELFEALLVATIVRSYLTRRGSTLKPMWVGVGAGIAVSVAVGLGFVRVQEALSGEALDHFQTAVLIACAVLMTHMCLWMKRHARTMKKELETSLGKALEAASPVFLASLVALAIAREGFEAVVYLYGMGLSGAVAAGGLAAAGGVSLVLALASAYALNTGLKFINPKIFFRVTGIFLLLTASSMFLAATARLLQAGIVPPLIDQVWDISWVLDDRTGLGAALASVAGYQSAPALTSVLVYAAFWLIYALMGRETKAPVTRTAATTAAAAGVVLLVLGAPPARADVAKKIQFSGYGDMQAQYLRYGPDRKLAGGAQKDSRLVFDQTRFTAKMEGYYLPLDVEFEAEVEFEHGGAGVSKEIEYDEAGEFETDVEKGGEVQLEELYLKKTIDEHFAVTAGRLLVAIGLLSRYELPTDYLGVGRPETETVMLPGTWTELGLSLDADFSDWKLTAQLVNGLDSSGFSSLYWVARGHQGRFETVTATNPAGILRVDNTSFAGWRFGVAGYYGDTSANRQQPKPDLIRACNRQAQDEVAPCGYIKAPVTIADAHASFVLTNLRGSLAGIWGQLKNADKISERNKSLSNDAGLPRSPVASEAHGAWGELGYDIAALTGMASGVRLEPFARYERYDTMAKTAKGTVRSPRSDRRIASLGVAYTHSDAVFFKLDASRRAYGASVLRKEDAVEAGLGFIY